MDPNTVQVAMLHQDPHPAHRGFADAIGADLVPYHGYAPESIKGTLPADVINSIRYPSYDVYLAEGSRPLYAGLLRCLPTNSTLLYLCADHGLYDIGRSNFQGDSLIKTAVGRFGVPAIQALTKVGIDGVIAVSELAATFSRSFVSADTPVSIAHPYVQPDVYQQMSELSPSFDTNTAVTVSRNAHYKGVDVLVDAWPAVRDKHPDAELHIVGKGHPESYEHRSGVTVHGYVPDLGSVLGAASLYVQPSRMDTFPVSCLEAMSAGLPILVTNRTGTYTEARELDRSLVVEPTAPALADGISAYFERPIAERKNLSRNARQRSERFTESNCTAAFKESFESVLTRI